MSEGLKCLKYTRLDRHTPPGDSQSCPSTPTMNSKRPECPSKKNVRPCKKNVRIPLGSYRPRAQLTPSLPSGHKRLAEMVAERQIWVQELMVTLLQELMVTERERSSCFCFSFVLLWCSSRGPSPQARRERSNPVRGAPNLPPGPWIQHHLPL